MGTGDASKGSMAQLSSVPTSTSVVARIAPRCITPTVKSREANSESATSTTKPAMVFKPQERKTEAEPKVTASLCKVAPTGPSTVVQVTSSPASCETVSKIMVTSGTTVTIPSYNVAKATVKGKNTQVAVPHCHKSYPPAASHQTIFRPEHKSPSTEPSHIFPTKMKPSEKPPKVGKYHLYGDSVSLSGFNL